MKNAALFLLSSPAFAFK